MTGLVPRTVSTCVLSVTCAFTLDCLSLGEGGREGTEAAVLAAYSRWACDGVFSAAQQSPLAVLLAAEWVLGVEAQAGSNEAVSRHRRVFLFIGASVVRWRLGNHTA